jgi:Phosphodiester glycosidase
VRRPATPGPGPQTALPSAPGEPPVRRKLRSRPTFRIIALVLLVFLGWTAWSVEHALTMPGGGTVSERLAEWARDHYLGPVVTFTEWVMYTPPKVGGQPSFSLAMPTTGTTAGTVSHKRHHRKSKHQFTGHGFGRPGKLTSPAGKPVNGEGHWRILARVHGVPAIYGTYLRPDKVHTSYVAGIASMNPHLLKFELHPGSEDPGAGNWGKAQPDIPPGQRRGLLATFNGGFKVASSQGGFFLNGTTRGVLQRGIASMVFYKNGDLTIGVWGQHGLRMTGKVAGVRQNLRPVVINGRVPSSVDQNVQTNWGATLGGGYFVWRSGVGVTADGRIIYVYGPALDVRTLASLLQRAGCVTAMELDINPDWMSYMTYKPQHHPANPVPVNLLPTQIQPATRYYAVANRDFTAVYAR